MQQSDLKRFLDAQEHDYATALLEIRSGRKRSHWIWYIFPQIAGLGHSDMAGRYAIQDLSGASAYLADPVLGFRLIEISNALLRLESNNATDVMGSPDDMKLRSCMTLFSLVANADPVFKAVLAKYFDGKADKATLELV